PLAVGNESEDGGGVLRSRVYNLRHISSGEARDLFSQLNIGKSYNTLTPDVLIITSNIGSDLIKATEIIDVLDQTPLVQIRTLMVASQSQPLPPLDELLPLPPRIFWRRLKQQYRTGKRNIRRRLPRTRMFSLRLRSKSLKNHWKKLQFRLSPKRLKHPKRLQNPMCRNLPLNPMILRRRY
ncbi:MAG: hypothetical protein ACYSPJ_05095, partial [Planctomycetota bacterium]